MSSPGPTRRRGDLADLVEMLLDKGVVINADIAVTIGDTELLGVQVRAALASFETAAQYGLEFPEGTDMERVEAAASGRSGRHIDDESEGGEAGSEEAGSEEAAEAVTGEGQSEEDADTAHEPESPNRVAVRPHATTGEEEDEEGDDADD